MQVDLLHNQEVEQSILASAMTQDGLLLIKSLKVKTEDFYSSRHKEIFRAVLKTYEKENTIDLILLFDYFKSNKELLASTGGITYITEVHSSRATNAQIEKYVELLKGYKLKRDICNIPKVIEKNIDKDPKELSILVHNEILTMQDKTSAEKSQNDLLELYLDNKEKAYTGEKSACNTIKTGLRKLDRTIEGFSDSELITIFAFSSVGKSVLAGQISLNMARQKKKIMYFSLEMSYQQVMDRLISNSTGIEIRKIKYINRNSVSDEEFTRIAAASTGISNYISIYSNTDFQEIISKIQIEKLKNNVDICFIDYIGLIDGVKGFNRVDEISKITRGFKKLALELNMPIVIVAQSSQGAGKKDGKEYKSYEKISDTDIADSASVYRDSDTVLGLYRNKSLEEDCKKNDSEITIDYSRRDPTVNPNCCQIYVNKCRSSIRKVLSFEWNGANSEIRNYQD